MRLGPQRPRIGQRAEVHRGQEACPGGIRLGQVDDRLFALAQRARERILGSRPGKPARVAGHISGREICDERGSGTRARSFSTKRSAAQISSRERILSSVIPAARPIERTSSSDRSVKNPLDLRGQDAQMHPRGASTCLALGNSSPSTARDEAKRTITSIWLTALVATEAPSGKGSRRRANPTGGSRRGGGRPPLIPRLRGTRAPSVGAISRGTGVEAPPPKPHAAPPGGGRGVDAIAADP